ncbi:hypothetical protein D9V86_11480 [Bacteroidetes/Chlorobi group bacterium ChocPot_Mid]|jgi:carbonic anhydrase|nr:MAG: hypothetical protein D9V86_11480 [Bacteroidetes/Chlorobi group bacterium ChocPot_Mid]
MNNKNKFCTVINCMDGRTQLPVIDYMKTKFNVEYVDMITEAGPIKYLAEADNEIILNSIFERIDISINKHFSRVIAVVGHQDCARNPLNKMEQVKQINSSIYLLRHKYKDCKIIGLYVNEIWEVEEI